MPRPGATRTIANRSRYLGKLQAALRAACLQSNPHFNRSILLFLRFPRHEGAEYSMYGRGADYAVSSETVPKAVRRPIERLERRLRLVVIGRAKTLGEPPLNRREKVADREAADRARRERNTR